MYIMNQILNVHVHVQILYVTEVHIQIKTP